MSHVAELQCPCGCGVRYVRADLAGDDRGDLIPLAKGYLGIHGSTLQKWARKGRLRAFKVERGRAVAWSRDIRIAIESAPVDVKPDKATPSHCRPERGSTAEQWAPAITTARMGGRG